MIQFILPSWEKERHLAKDPVKDGAKVKGVVMEKEKLNGNMAYAEIALLVEIVSSLIYLYYLPVTANIT